MGVSHSKEDHIIGEFNENETSSSSAAPDRIGMQNPANAIIVPRVRIRPKGE